MRVLVALALLAACDDFTDEPQPDATAIATDAAVGCAEHDAPADAGGDAADPCWMHRHPTCNGDVLDLCVPYTGCVSYTCNGVVMGFCGPG